jgi:hypothetical protein
MSKFEVRKKLLKQIEESRNSKAISYITGDRRQLETQISPEIIDLFVQHLDAIGPVQKLSLILHTNGGDTSAAWRLVNLLHTFCDELEVIIPTKALSAGTLISLGADKIVMTKQAALGPIDPSLNHPLNPQIPRNPQMTSPVSVEAVRGYLDAASDFGITDQDVLGQILIDLSNKVHPLVLGQIFRSRSQIRFLATKLIKRQVQDSKKVKQIITFLCAESGSHDYTINRREARELGLQIENPSNELYDILSRFYQSYVAEFDLLSPYDPYSMVSPNSSHAYTLPRAAIESIKAGSHQFISEGVLQRSTVQIPGANGLPQQHEAINDSRRFEGWRKIK